MLKMLYTCDCGAEGEVTDLEGLIGYCPACHAHHGEVHYASAMTPSQFIEELSKMSEREIAKYAYAIQVCAEDIIESNL